MMHPTEDTLQAHLDGELAGVAREGVDRHVTHCDECRSILATLQRTAAVFSGAVAMLDADEPARWNSAGVPLMLGAPLEQGAGARAGGAEAADSAVFAAGEADAVAHVAAPGSGGLRVVPISPRVASRRRAERRGAFPFASLRWAAGIVLTTVAAGSAAVVAIPQLRTIAQPPAEQPAAALASTRQGAPQAGTVAAVAVRPLQNEVRVTVTNLAAGSRLRIELSDGTDVVVEVRGEAQARFEARDGRVSADLGGGVAEVRVGLPRTVRASTIMVDDEVVARTVDGQVMPSEAATDGMLLPARP